MAIDIIAPEKTMDPSSLASDTSGGDGEPRPKGDNKKAKPNEPGVVCLDPKRMGAPPGYLTLSLTRRSAPAAAKYRRWKRPGEVSLANVDAPRDYLSLSLTPSDQPKRRRGGVGRDVSGGCGSAASSGTTEGALVVVGGVLPPPPVQIPTTCLPPKKRNLAAAGVYQETAGTAPASTSRCLPHCVTGPSSPPGDSQTRPSATMTSRPIDAVPLRAVYVHGGVPYQFRLSSGTEEIITTNDATSASSSVAAGSSCPSSSAAAPVDDC